MSTPNSFRNVRHQATGLNTPPQYNRVVQSLSDADLEDEILMKRGEPGYQAALLVEADRRARRGAPE